MASTKKRDARRKRVGRVSYYYHHGGWHVYYRDGQRQVRRRVADTAEEAERIAAQVNAQVSAYRPTLFGFVKISVAELRQRFLDHHEHVLRSSLATVDRYRTATKRLEDFAATGGRSVFAHEVQPEQFLRYLRSLKVPANGHSSPVRRPLRDKGLRFILEACRSLYGFAAKQRHLPPYAENPFAGLGRALVRIENAKPVFVFDETTELAFFRAVDNWSFPLHFMLAKTGMRPGELMHLLVEDVDLDAGWLHVRNKPELGWRSKTGRVRMIPLGHKPRHDATGSLGMTAVYTHTRAESQKREIERALRLWLGSLELARTWAEGGAL
ncbi:MAG: tyrosine-type recombinase/integrase [Pirellulales bacterium]